MPEFLGVGVYFSDCSPVMANLRDVSTEVALEVIKYLDIYDLLSVALVSRRMRDVAQVEIFKNLKLAYLKGGADVDCNGQRLIKVLQDNLALRSHVRSLYLRFSSHNRGASLTTVLPLVNLRHIILCDRFSSVSPLVDYGSSLPILTQLLSYPSIQTITIHNHDESSTLSTTFTLDHSLDHSFPALHTLDTPPPNVTSALIAALARTCSGKISTTNVLVTSPWNAVAHLDDVNMLLAVGENTIETLNIIFPPSSWIWASFFDDLLLSRLSSLRYLTIDTGDMEYPLYLIQTLPNFPKSSKLRVLKICTTFILNERVWTKLDLNLAGLCDFVALELKLTDLHTQPWDDLHTQPGDGIHTSIDFEKLFPLLSAAGKCKVEVAGYDKPDLSLSDRYDCDTLFPDNSSKRYQPYAFA